MGRFCEQRSVWRWSRGARRRWIASTGLAVAALAVGIGSGGCGGGDGAGRDAGAGDGGLADAASWPDGGPARDSGVGDGGAVDSGGSDGGGSDGGGSDAGPSWVPPGGATWHIQYSDLPVDTSVDVQVYDIDLFETPSATVAALQAAGRRVVCYFSAGSHEDWRPDAADFPPDSLGNDLAGWPGERWLDVRHPGLWPVMLARLDLAVSKGCDGVDPDNVDGYANDSGFPLTYADQLAYNTRMAQEAHARGLAVGLKNDLDQILDLEPLYDFAVNEECLDFAECDLLAPFVVAGKPVFHIEYVDTAAQGPARLAGVCGEPSRSGFSTLIKTWDLDAWFLACP